MKMLKDLQLNILEYFLLRIKMEIEKEKLEVARHFIYKVLDNICKRFNLNYYELLGVLDVVTQDVHVAARSGDGL